DDKTAYILEETRIVAVDLVTGQTKTLLNLTDATLTSAAVASDGRTLAFFAHPRRAAETKVATIEADGTNYREIYTTTNTAAFSPNQIQWTREGRALFFIEDGRVMRLSLQGGSPEYTGLTMARPERNHPISLAPDGSTIVFSDGAPLSASQRSELWVLEN